MERLLLLKVVLSLFVDYANLVTDQQIGVGTLVDPESGLVDLEGVG
jgi:hypothetical protein